MASLQDKSPETAKFWHTTKNKASPKDVYYRSKDKVWWKCSINENHEEYVSILNMYLRKYKCLYCINKKVCIDNCLKTQKPKIAKEWHPTKNKSLTPETVTPFSDKRAWWICPNNKDHVYDAQIKNRSNGKGCPYCSGHKVDMHNSLFHKSPNIAKEWHPTKNKKLTSKDVTYKSGKKVWWLCSVDETHEWQSIIGNRTRLGKGCPYCSNQRVNHQNSLQNVFPEIAKEWHPTKNGNLTSNDVTSKAKKSVWWLCKTKDSEHIWKTSIYSRTKLKTGCPFCIGQKVCKSNCLETTHPVLSKEWHPTKNKNLYPRNVTYGLRKKVWWKCNKCKNEWQSSLNNRSRGRGCPKCSKGSFSKGSIDWLTRIEKQKGINIQHSLNIGEYTIEIEGYKVGAKVDGYCQKTNTVYEYMGCMFHGHQPKVCTDRKKYNHDKQNPLNRKTYGELYKNTIERIEKIKKKGYKVVVIWECQYKKSLKKKKRSKDIYDIYDLDKLFYD